MDEQGILIDLIELFPAEGQVVPYVEIKFRLAAKHGTQEVEDTLSRLENTGILSKFEFNNTVHYKSKKDIPVALSATSGENGPSSASEDKLTQLVLAIARTIDDPQVKQLLAEFER